MASKQRIGIKNKGSIMVLELLDTDILDEIIINDITESLFSILEENKPEYLILSFSRVRHLSSMALGMLVRLNSKTAETGIILKLCDIKPSLLEVFLITKMDKVFNIYDTCDKAFDSFS